MSSDLQHLEAEMSALGAMCLDRQAAQQGIVRLRTEMFVRPAHRSLFEAIKELTGAGTAIDPVTMRKATRGDVSDDYLLQVADFTPSPANASFYFDIVAEFHYRREIFDRAKKLAKAAQDMEQTPEHIRAFVSGMQSETLNAGGKDPWAPIATVELGEGDLGLSTGFPSIDGFVTTKGYPLGQMSVVEAATKGGKTAYMLASCAATAKDFGRVAYCTLADMGKRQLLARLLKGESGWSRLPDQRSIGCEVQKALDGIREWDLDIWQSSVVKDSTVETMLAYLEARHEVRPFDIVFVDYAQRINSSDKKATTTVEEQRIVSQKISGFADRFQLPIVVGSQITVDHSGKPNTQYSKSWEHDAGLLLNVAFVPKENAAEPQMVRVTSRLSRFGPTGVSASFLWDEKKLRIKEVAN